MAEYHADEFIRLAFPGADFKIIYTKLEKELIIFHCVKLWEYEDEILSGKQEYLSFVPLLLELSSKPDKNLLVRQRELIQQEKGIEKGMQKGKLQGIKDDIIETLNIRFKSVNGIANLLNTIKKDTSRKVFHIALTVNSPKAFKNSVNNMIKK